MKMNRISKLFVLELMAAFISWSAMPKLLQVGTPDTFEFHPFGAWTDSLLSVIEEALVDRGDHLFALSPLFACWIDCKLF